MDFIEGRAVRSHHTFLEKLALADGHGANGVNGLHTLFDFLFQLAIEQGALNIGVGVLGTEGDDDVAGASSHVLLHGGLDTLLRDDQGLHSNQVTIGGDHVDDIVDLPTVAANLSASVVGLVVVTDEGRQGVLTNAFRDTEAHHDVHLGEVAVKFLLRHFVDAADDVFIRLTERFANSLEIPWMARCTNGVPSLQLPLVTLFTRCCTCLCTHFLRHVDQLGVSCGGYPTCKLPTHLPYLNGPHRENAGVNPDSATS